MEIETITKLTKEEIIEKFWYPGYDLPGATSVYVHGLAITTIIDYEGDLDKAIVGLTEHIHEHTASYLLAYFHLKNIPSWTDDYLSREELLAEGFDN